MVGPRVIVTSVVGAVVGAAVCTLVGSGVISVVGGDVTGSSVPISTGPDISEAAEPAEKQIVAGMAMNKSTIRYRLRCPLQEHSLGE